MNKEFNLKNTMKLNNEIAEMTSRLYYIGDSEKIGEYYRGNLTYNYDIAKCERWISERKALENEINLKKSELLTSCKGLNEALESIQKRCTARTIEIYEICKKLTDIEEHIGIPKKYMEGIKVSVDINAQNFPRSYKYNPDSTIFYAYFKNGSWRITDIERDRTRNDGHGIKIELTETAKNEIINRITEY